MVSVFLLYYLMAASSVIAPPPRQVWFALTEEEIKTIRPVLRERFQVRDAVIEAMQLGMPPDGVNLQFVDRFLDYFQVNNDDLCQPLTEGNKILNTKFLAEAGVGKVYMAALKRYPEHIVIIKSIAKSHPPQYLTLRIHDLEGGGGWGSYIGSFTHVEDLVGKLELMSPWIRVYPTQTSDSPTRKLVTLMSRTDFVNQTLLHLILNLILEDNPYYLYQFDAYWCEDTGYNVTEFATQGDLHDYLSRLDIYNPDTRTTLPGYWIILTALQQLLSALSILKADYYSFCHSDLKGKNVFVSGTKDDPVFKIADYDKSSITWHGMRIYNGTLDYTASVNPFPITTTPDGIDWYQVYAPGKVVPLQKYTMHSAYGFYLSYDIYSLLTSLLAIEGIWQYMYDSYLSDYTLGGMEAPAFDLYKLYKSLWQPEDFTKIMQYLATNDQWRLMVKISKMNQMFAFLQVHMRVNVDVIYRYVGVDPPVNDTPAKEIAFVKSDDGHVCLTPCSSKRCTTNRYRKTGWTGGITIYDWDNCSSR